MFSLKRNQKKSEEGLISCSEICFLKYLSCFHTLLFPPLLQVAFFHQTFLDGTESFPGPFVHSSKGVQKVE